MFLVLMMMLVRCESVTVIEEEEKDVLSFVLEDLAEEPESDDPLPDPSEDPVEEPDPAEEPAPEPGPVIPYVSDQGEGNDGQGYFGSISLNCPTPVNVGQSVLVSGKGKGVVRYIRATCDGAFLHEMELDDAGNYYFQTSFNTAGKGRTLKVSGLDIQGKAVAEASVKIDVLAAPQEEPADSNLTIWLPAESKVGAKVPMSGWATLDIKTVVLTADEYQIGEVKAESNGHWEHGYIFNSASAGKLIVARGYDAQFVLRSQAAGTITIHAEASPSGIDLTLPSGTQVGVSTEFKGTTSADIEQVVVTVDGWQIKELAPSNGKFSFNYSFYEAGQDRKVLAQGFNGQGTIVATDTAWIDVSGGASIAFASPASYEVMNPVTFQVNATGGISKVKYYAENEWLLGESTSASTKYKYTYAFNTKGKRTVTAKGYSSSGSLLAQSDIVISVKDDSPAPGEGPTVSDVPYFYQYANQYSPGSTCQNTAIAMLLGWYGWTGNPDTITLKFGKSYGQTPGGVAEIFNYYAKQMGIPQRLKPHTAGTIGAMKALLAAGRPVIIHGYFTSAGHVMLTLGYGGGKYTVHDPAGQWNQNFKGGYGSGWAPTAGKYVKYNEGAFELAVASLNGYDYEPLWYSEIIN